MINLITMPSLKHGQFNTEPLTATDQGWSLFSKITRALHGAQAVLFF